MKSFLYLVACTLCLTCGTIAGDFSAPLSESEQPQLSCQKCHRPGCSGCIACKDGKKPGCTCPKESDEQMACKCKGKKSVIACLCGKSKSLVTG